MRSPRTAGGSSAMASDNSASDDAPPRWLNPARRAAVAETERFDELARLLQLDPANDFRFADLSTVDFSGSSLDGFDLTAARLIGCSFKGARIKGCFFDQAELGNGQIREPPADLTAAADYETFA